MATVFNGLGTLLCKDNMVERDSRERLPSPNELKRKIILKGSFKDVKLEQYEVCSYVHLLIP